jgi:hypothetical protein
MPIAHAVNMQIVYSYYFEREPSSEQEEKLAYVYIPCMKDISEMCRHIAKRYKIRIVKNGVFWDVTPRDSCENRRFGGT